MKTFSARTLISACLIGLVSACSGPTAQPVLKTISGKTIDFKALDNHTVLVNYWADWCEPCKKEIPALNRFAKQHPDVWIVGVNFDGVDIEHQKALIKKNHIDYFNLPSDPSAALGIGDIPAVPVSFVFNPKGRLKEKLYGPQTVASLEKAIQ